MSLSQELHDQTLNRIVDTLGMKEVAGKDGGPFLPLVSQVPMVQGKLGQLRVYQGGPLTQLVSCTIIVPPIGLDSHMLFAFTDTEGAVPHFTLDSVRNGETYAFHLDLIPRVDLATNLPYMDEVFAPLSETFKATRDMPGLTPAQLDPRQYAVMSPWMFVSRADEAAFRKTFATVKSYLDHWFKVLEKGVSKAASGDSTPAQRATRDEVHRSILFSPDVDKVWNQITPLIGADSVSRMIAQLRSTRA